MLTVRETRHGPVISDLHQRRSGPVLAVAMANLPPGDTAAAGLLALNHAQTVQEAGKAAAEITSPVQNLLVADRTDHRAVSSPAGCRSAAPATGPRRCRGDGAHDWVGWASGDQLPHYVSPGQRPAGERQRARSRRPTSRCSSAATGSATGVPGASAQLLDAIDRHTAADFAAHADGRASARFAQQVLPALLAVPPQPGAAGKAQALLKGWDGAMTMDAPQPLIFNAWMERFYALVLRQAGIAAGRRRARCRTSSRSCCRRPARIGAAATATPSLAEALKTAVADLSARFGADPAAWRWGAAHQAVFAHPVLRAIPVLGALTTAHSQPGRRHHIDRGGTALRRFHVGARRGVSRRVRPGGPRPVSCSWSRPASPAIR